MQAPEYLPAPSGPAAVGDLRFRTLVGESAWAELPEAVRRRFSKCLAPDETLIYRGTCRRDAAVACRARPLLSRPRHRRAAAADRRRHRPGAGRRHRGSPARRTELAAHLRPPRTLPAGDPLDQALPRRRRALRSTWAAGSACRCASRSRRARSSSARRHTSWSSAAGVCPFRARSHPGRMQIEHRDEGAGSFAFALAADASAARPAGASAGHLPRRLSATRAGRRGMRL